MPEYRFSPTRLAFIVVAALATVIPTAPTAALGSSALDPLAFDPTEIFDSAEALAEAVEANHPGSQPIIVPAAAFSPASPVEGFYFPFGNGYVRGEDRGCLTAPASLPHGASPVGVVAYVYDNAAADVYVTLWRKELASDYPAEPLAFLSSDGAAPAIQMAGTWSIERAPVDHTEYAYYLTTCLESDEHRLNAVRIEVVPATR